MGNIVFVRNKSRPTQVTESYRKAQAISWTPVLINESNIFITKKTHSGQNNFIIWYNQQASLLFTTQYLSPWHECFPRVKFSCVMDLL
ncbi:hypothetical protein AC70_4431 [Escherichia coli 2-210-07_S4_C1]|nr:hypothetical protein AC70_4431 [Escherichia coli 2-210-07_S4_C1]